MTNTGLRTFRVLALDRLRAPEETVDEVLVLREHPSVNTVFLQPVKRDPMALHLLHHDLPLGLHLSRRFETSVGEASVGDVVECTRDGAGDHGAANAISIGRIGIVRRPSRSSAGGALRDLAGR